MADSKKAMRKFGVGLGVLLLLFVIVSLVLPFFSKVAEPAKPGLAEKEKSFPVLDAEMNWAEMDRAGLVEISENFIEMPDFSKQVAAREIYRKDFSEMVRFGETMIVGGAEKEDGVFAFTSITPEIGTEIPDMVVLTIKSFEVDVSGGVTNLSLPQIATRDGAEAKFQSMVNKPVTGGFQAIGTELSITPVLVSGGAILTGSILETGE